MNNPKLYEKFNGLQRRDATDILDEYLDLVKWRNNGDDVILDIGSGSGDITCELLLPRLPNDFQQLVGVDVCESMVKFARSKYIHPNLQFDTLDIGTAKLPDKFKQKFHHVFSFYCLHWIQEQRQVMKNIFDLLQPGGDALLMMLANNPIYDIYTKLAKMDIWKTYLVNTHKYISPYHNVEDAENIVQSLLETVGFQVQVCHLKNKVYEYEDLNILQKSMIAVNPFFASMSDTIKEQFVADYLKEVLKLKICQENNNNKETIIMPYSIIVIYCTKPT